MILSKYEDRYITNLKYILTAGNRELNQRTGIVTYRVPSTQIIVDLTKEFPILLSKKVNWKSAVKEILWIMQRQSNRINELDSHIWDSWADEDGTIGKAYGYQVAQPVKRSADKIYSNQVEYVLNTLAKDPSNRECVINMWNVADLDRMNLVPCAYSSIWSIVNGRLNCMLVQRSADYPVGVPFNTTQYAVLTHLFARHLGVKAGLLTHVMADSHIYENQISGVRKQLEQYDCLCTIESQHPRLIFKEDAPTDFWQITIDDMQIDDYVPFASITYEVAI